MTRPISEGAPKPVGSCHIVGVEQRGSNEIAIYARIKVRDDEGNRFYFDASTFSFDLKEETP